MGTACSCSEKQDLYEYEYRPGSVEEASMVNPSACTSSGCRSPHPGGINSHLMMAMYKTNLAAAALAAPAVDYNWLHPLGAQALIRKAKCEGCTVTVVDGNLYIDYKFIGSIPPGLDVRI